MLLLLCMPHIWFDRSFDLFKWQKVIFVFIPDTRYLDSIVNMNPNKQQINYVHYVFGFSWIYYSKRIVSESKYTTFTADSSLSLQVFEP